MRSDIVPGAIFPNYELPDHTGELRKLSELQGDDPLILTLARGHYCPKEHQQHLELAAFYPKIAVAYTQIATIATDDHHTLQEFRASVGAGWTFLSDPDRTVQKDLDIQEYTDPEHNPMIPHTLVLKPGLVIYSIYNSYWFWGRPSVADLWHDLRAVTSEIRPDWDLSTPGLREAWNAGDLSRFHGWNKRSATTQFRIGDEIEIADADVAEDVRRATVTRFLSDKEQGMSPEIEEYIDCWIEVTLKGASGDTAGQLVVLRTDSQYLMNGRHVLLRKAGSARAKDRGVRP